MFSIAPDFHINLPDCIFPSFSLLCLSYQGGSTCGGRVLRFNRQSRFLLHTPLTASFLKAVRGDTDNYSDASCTGSEVRFPQTGDCDGRNKIKEEEEEADLQHNSVNKINKFIQIIHLTSSNELVLQNAVITQRGESLISEVGNISPTSGCEHTD